MVEEFGRAFSEFPGESWVRVCLSVSWEGMTGSSGMREALWRGPNQGGIRYFLTVTLGKLLGVFELVHFSCLSLR